MLKSTKASSTGLGTPRFDGREAENALGCCCAKSKSLIKGTSMDASERQVEGASSSEISGRKSEMLRGDDGIGGDEGGREESGVQACRRDA
jgi:hypothetical protein